MRLGPAEGLDDRPAAHVAGPRGARLPAMSVVLRGHRWAARLKSVDLRLRSAACLRAPTASWRRMIDSTLMGACSRWGGRGRQAAG